MKTAFLSLLLALLPAMFARAETNVVGDTYTFLIPDEVHYEKHLGAELYSFTWDDGSLMLSAQPAAIKPSMLKMMVGITETTFDKTMKKNSADMELAKKRTEVSYGTFKGTELAYTITTKKAGVTTRQVIYMLTDGERIWNGQVSVESDKDLAIARTILEKAKPIDKNAKKKQPDFAKPKKP